MSQLDIDYLLTELTISEKVSLLAGIDFWHTVPIPRLNIPSIRVSDGPNGIRGTKFFDSVPSNCFPCGTALASSFNLELLQEAGKLMGKEAKMKGAHCILGPTCNIARSPLGGRFFESYSEDPVLSGHAASHVIKGIQSEKVLACIKHFVCNDQEDFRKGVDARVSERALREVYLKPFQIALRDADPKALMTAYNKVNGIHCSESKGLLQDILRKEWGFEGLVMSDWNGTYTTKDALDAGLNLEMPGPTRFRQEVPTNHEIFNNVIHRDVIDENVRHVLNFINQSLKVGIPKDVVESPNDSPEAKAFLRKVGAETIVLLKNEKNVLPLSKSATKNQKRIAVIGPNAKVAQDSGGGSASLNSSYKITPFEGIKSKLDDSVILEYSLGGVLEKNHPDMGALVVNEEGNPGVTAKFYKRPPGSEDRELFETYQFKSTRLSLSDFKSKHLDLGDTLFYVDFVATFTPDKSATYDFGCSVLGTAQIFVNDKLVVDNKTNQVKGDAYFLGTGSRQETGTIFLEKDIPHSIRVEFGTAPTSSLPTQSSEIGGVYFGVRVKSTPEDDLEHAVELAKTVDKVVLVVGLSKEWESEGFDRPDMDIPGWTNKLIFEVAKVNPNVIVVNQSGTPVSMPWINDVQGLVQAWYGGNELGNTIADVLFGDVNPSGKLSLTFPKKLEDNSSYLNFGSTNGEVLYGEDVFVGYKYYEKKLVEPLFAFGYGLSYTSFELSNLKVSVDKENITIKVNVKNTGSVDGAEVVQVYISHDGSSINKPAKELKSFDKLYLKAGKSRTSKLVISIRDATSYWNSYYHKWESEKGIYKVLVGTSSDNIILEDKFETGITLRWLGL